MTNREFIPVFSCRKASSYCSPLASVFASCAEEQKLSTHAVVSDSMLASRAAAAAAVAAGFSLITVAEHMSSVAGPAHCELRGPHGRRLQRLVGVSGCGPNRVNDLLLLRAESDGEERSSNRHVVFFHGDIQVRLPPSLHHVSGQRRCGHPGLWGPCPTQKLSLDDNHTTER